MADPERPGLPDPADVLRRLGQGLAQAARQLEESGEPALAALAPEIEGFTRTLEAAADAMTAASDAARGPAQLLWLHEIRGAVTTVVGWVDLLAMAREEPRRERARAAIEQSVRILRERLTQPPP